LLSTSNPEKVPNPAIDEFVIKLSRDEFTTGKLIITSLDGRPMGEFGINGTETRIDISTFGAGIYLLEIFVNDTRFIRRLIKH
jgi:DNA topoisomerase VI subunit A